MLVITLIQIAVIIIIFIFERIQNRNTLSAGSFLLYFSALNAASNIYLSLDRQLFEESVLDSIDPLFRSIDLTIFSIVVQTIITLILYLMFWLRHYRWYCLLYQRIVLAVQK